MPKDYLNSLESACKEFVASRKEIFDIVIYGSSARGKTAPNDIDITVIFFDTALRPQLETINELKKTLKSTAPNLDIKGMNMKDFFNPDFLARQAVLIEGRSIIDRKTLAQKLGFKGTTLFSYTLQGLTHNEKVKFNFSMKGRGKKGVLDSVSGTAVGRGVVSVPIEKADDFEEFLKKWNITFKKKRVLEETY
jgi:predicted nucleotidyltransferase